MFKHIFSKKIAVTLLAAFAFCAASCSEAVMIPSSDEHIQYFGRWEMGEGTSRSGYGATYIKANFYGTGITACTSGENSWWRCSIDGGEFQKFNPNQGKTVLAEGLSLGEHSIFLIRSTEGEAGINEFKGFDIHDGYMLPPDPMRQRRIEFVGDSITAGAFNDGSQGMAWHDRQDGNMAFGPQLARMLDADYSVVAKSGEGVLRNYDETIPPYDGVHTADRYAWVFYNNRFGDDNKNWDFDNFPVDLVIVAIGTNDFAWGKPLPNKMMFIDKYKELISTIRKHNPEAVIICTSPVPSVDKKASQWVEKSVLDVQTSGDDKLYYIDINENGPLLSADDYVGDNTHPTKEGATKIALFLKDRVAKIMNWQLVD